MTQKRHSAAKTRLGWLVLCALVGGASGGYFGFYLPYHSRQREQERRIETLQRVVERLTSERRIAQVAAVSRSIDPATGYPSLNLQFVEFDHAGRAMPPRHFYVLGDVVYFDALVIKFENDYVAAGDALRGRSIYLFRRVFGEKQAPETGEPIDDSGFSGTGIPDVYRVAEAPSAYEVELWSNFWRYANDPEAAKAAGVRVVQGEAVYTKILLERIYTLTIEADGGINIVANRLPPALAPNP